MAFDTYLLIDNASTVKGEATATGLQPATGWIEIFSFSWGASNPTTVGTTAAGLSAGKVSISSFNFMKKLENSSPNLFQACATGQHFKTAKVVLRKAAGTTGKQTIFLEYDFTDVMVESVQVSGSSGGDDTPTESVSMAFAAITEKYWPQDTATGGQGTLNTGSWDLTKAAVAAG
jgi:type VI secretion system secreted protein Hcp